MRIVHDHIGERIAGDGHQDIRILLTNREGSYLSVPSGSVSRYDGFFWFDGTRMLRIIDDIKTLQAPSPIEIRNSFGEAERVFSSFSERFFVPFNRNGMHLRLSQSHPMVFDLDCRESYDARVWGRDFQVRIDGQDALITYTKSKDGREDGGEGVEYVLFVAIKADGPLSRLGQWVQKHYDADEARQSPPVERHVYRAVEATGTRAAIGVGWTAEEAKAQCDAIFDGVDQLRSSQGARLSHLLGWHLADAEVGMAFRAAIAQLFALSTSKGIFAGLPWFFQRWGRDQSISLKACMLQKRYGFCKDVIVETLKRKDPKGRISNILDGQGLGSADATGWAIVRLGDLMEALERDGQVKLYFSKEELQGIIAQIEAIVDEVTKNCVKQGLVENDRLETWMDTSFGGDERAGIRLEIQALHIASCKVLFRLTGKKFYGALADNMIKQVRKRLWNGSWLADGVGDETIRPNIFLAYYLVPDLLEREHWHLCFHSALKALYLTWGGLSTIDINNPLFVNRSTGQDVRSYHRGDSWFWVNDLAALCLHRLDKTRYHREIDRIVRASTQEILFQGAIGHHAELSSAEDLRSEGCWSQAWSAAMYIELVTELFVK